MLKKFIGDKAFYKKLIMIALPVMVQNGITQFVNMLDNIMVGRVGTVEMTGVAVANQLIFVFNLCIFGALSGAGIFGAQFYGSRNIKGVRDTFRFKIISCSLIGIAAIAVFLLFGEPLINLYLRGDGSVEDAAAALTYAKDYLSVMTVGFIPYIIAQCYSSTLRETGRTVLPMVAGIAAVVVNLVFNYILIFGKLGAPVLGVKGAAIATVMSRFVELIIVMLWTHVHKNDTKFIVGAYRSLKVPMSLIKQIAVKGLPLMINEVMWALGVSVILQCYSVRGLDVVAAVNISQTFFNVFSVAFMAVGVAISIILGQALGSDESHDSVMDTARKLITSSAMIGIITGGIYALAAEFIPLAYNTTDNVRSIATGLMQICALLLPFEACAHSCYFSLRSGGKTVTTFIFDSGYKWVIEVPYALILSYLTDTPILTLYLIIQLLNVIKCGIGILFVKKGSWIRNMVSDI